jgi:uncharacterized protein (TIGR02246 family)
MKSVSVAALILSVLALVAVENAAASMEDAIKQVFVQLDRCIANNDAKCVGEFFADDATYSEPSGGAKIIKGKAQIVKKLEAAFGSPNTSGSKVTHTVENVRVIGTDHAIVDSSVTVVESKPGTSGPLGSYRDVSVMVLKGNKWFCEDVRLYVIDPCPSGKENAAPPADKASAPAPPAKE